MSTRAVFTFASRGTDTEFHVYKHYDGYPSEALAAIRTAFQFFAWPLPRFEADEAAASFVAAIKAGNLIRIATSASEQDRDYARGYLPGGAYRNHAGGGARLLTSGPWHEVAPGDIEYRYRILQPLGAHPVGVEAYAVSQDWRTGAWSELKIGGTLLSTLLNLDDDALAALVAQMDARAQRKLKPLVLA